MSSFNDDQAESFYSTHNAGFQSFPFPKDAFLKFVKENDGYFPGNNFILFFDS